MQFSVWTTSKIMSRLLMLVLLPAVMAQVSISSLSRSQGWGPWSEWSRCSSTCDPEIATRTRDCPSSSSGVPVFTQGVTKTCNGTDKQYRVCDKKNCVGIRTDYRKYECDKQSRIPFRGKMYYWNKYINTRDKCIVACKAARYGFYSGFGRPVKDGLPCTDADTDHVCLAGKCQSISCDGVVGSKTRKDHCGVCGGDNSSCRIISGIYTRTHLKYGYNLITTIPAGACSVNITEMARTRNFLVLKYANDTSILNGDRRLSRTGDYNAAGTVIKYDKFSGPHCPGECISADGPLTVPLQLQVLSYRRNPGIKYMFTVPADMIDQVMSTFIGPSGQETPDIRGNNNENQQTENRLSSTAGSSTDNKEGVIRFGEKPKYVPPENSNSNQPLQTSNERQGGTQDAINRYRQRYFQETSTNQVERRRNQPQTNRTGSGTYNREYPQTGVYGTRTKYQSQDWTGYQHVNKPISGPESNRKPSLQISNTIDRVNFFWRISGFTECSRSCGGGNQQTKVVCMKRVANVIVTPENCDPDQKPRTQTVICNNKPCPPGWGSGNWSDCSQSCGTGMQTRRVECKQTISAEVTVPISASSCELGNRPVSSRSCRNQPCYDWNVGNWSECSVDCGFGRKTRSVTCSSVNGRNANDDMCEGVKPVTSQSCDMGACAQGWFHTEWSDECSTSCGEGHHTRDVYCSADDGTPLEERKCGDDKPRERKPCRKSRPCGGNWFEGPWEQCTATCGVGTRTRDVVCMKKLGTELFTIVDEVNCEGKEKPSLKESCPELPPCPAQWYMTEWSQCSKSCGTGTKTRQLKCLDSFLNPSSTCARRSKPSSRHSCNINECDRPQLDEEPGCRDQWTRCRLVVQARLCSYKYYRDQCCSSCREHQQKHQLRRRRKQK